MGSWDWKNRCRNKRKKKHEETYGKPMCHLCDECYTDKSEKHSGITYYCKLSSYDVGQSHFGWVSPKSCPKR